jgi:hypothetical protein
MEIDTNLVILGNTIIMAATLLATLYRIKIETKQVRVQEENAEYRKRVEDFRTLLKREKDDLKKMTPEELAEFIDYLEHLGD